jgi:hypothetical protein
MAEPARIITQLRQQAKLRNWGVIDQDRREIMRHGYLLALEDLERELQPQERAEETRREAV